MVSSKSGFLRVKMKKIRLISRLDVKGPNLIKGVHLEGLRVLGSPQEYAEKYYAEGADEILYIDLVASLYGRSKLTDIVTEAAKKIFVPLTVGGGIRSIEDVDQLLRAGADKIAINTFAVHNPDFISEVANRFGSQCLVLSIEAKLQPSGIWEVFTDCGRERSGKVVEDWVEESSRLGVGEILLTSIDREGTRKGFDTELIRSVSQKSNVPIIASGGFGQLSDLKSAVQNGADAIAIADALHYNKFSLAEIRSECVRDNIGIRRINL